MAAGAIARTTEGLRDALFGQLEDLRNGVSTAHESQAFAKIAEKVIETLYVDIAMERHKLSAERERIALENRSLPAPEIEADAIEISDEDG